MERERRTLCAAVAAAETSMSIFDPFVDVIAKTTDVVTSVIDRTPGFSELKKLLVEYPLVGGVILTALGSSLASSFANVVLPSVDGMRRVGPMIASVAFAVPGMVVKDQSFIDAYVSELTSRTVATAAYLATGPGAAALTAQLSAASGTAVSAIGKSALESAAYAETQRLIVQPLTKLVMDSGFKADIDRAINKAFTTLGATIKDLGGVSGRELMRKSGITPEDVAKRYSVRPDVAALAINGIAGADIYNVGDPTYADYDVLGDPKSGVSGPSGAPIPNVALAQLQENLRTVGYTVNAALGVGREDDPKLVVSIRDFQQKSGLPVTGKADPKTRQMLQTAAGLPRVAAEVRAAPNSSLSRDLQNVRSSSTAEEDIYDQLIARYRYDPQMAGPVQDWERLRKEAVRKRVAAMTALAAAPVAPQAFLPQLLTFSILTSPLWFTFLVLPRIQTFRARGRR